MFYKKNSQWFCSGFRTLWKTRKPWRPKWWLSHRPWWMERWFPPAQRPRTFEDLKHTYKQSLSLHRETNMIAQNVISSRFSLLLKYSSLTLSIGLTSWVRSSSTGWLKNWMRWKLNHPLFISSWCYLCVCVLTSRCSKFIIGETNSFKNLMFQSKKSKMLNIIKYFILFGFLSVQLCLPVALFRHFNKERFRIVFSVW